MVGGATKLAGGTIGAVKNVGQFAGAGLNVLGSTVGPVASKLGGGFMSLLGTFGPAITSLGTMVAVVSLLGDHFEDIRGIVGTVFGEGGLAIFDKFTGKISGIGDTAKQVFGQLSTPEGLPLPVFDNFPVSLADTVQIIFRTYTNYRIVYPYPTLVLSGAFFRM